MDDRTITAVKGVVTAAFVITWIGLAVVGLALNGRLTAAQKRRWSPRVAVSVGVLFVFFSSTLTVLETRRWSSLGILIIVIPFVALISYLNIKFTKFCDQCNATQYNANWFVPQRFCSKCSAELDGKPSSDGRLLD